MKELLILLFSILVAITSVAAFQSLVAAHGMQAAYSAVFIAVAIVTVCFIVITHIADKRAGLK